MALPEMPDPAKRASRTLDKELEVTEVHEDVTVVNEELKKQASEHPSVEPQVTALARDELSAPRVTASSGREKVRVLMISRERNVFVDGSPAQQRLAEYGKLFEELHIVVFTGDKYKFDGLQIAPNVWAYPTNSRSRWRYMIDAYRIIKRQLYFASGLRADVVTAQDPFDTGLLAYIVSRRFKRGLQLQVHVDFYEPYFLEQDDYNGFRVWLAWFLLPKADRVRVVSERLREEVVKRHRRLATRIDVLPVFVDIAAWRDSKVSFNLHERYPQFKFIILMASRLAPEKNIGFAINACQHVLRQYSTTGLVIVGEGPEQEKLQKQVAELGLSNKIVFEPWQNDLHSHMKTADMFLLTSSYEGYGQTLIEAAASGLPILTTHVGIAPTMIENGKSGLVCAIGDMGCVIKGINTYLGNAGLRQLYSREASARVFSFIETNVDTYHEAYRESIERAVLAADLRRGVTKVSTEELQVDTPAPTK